jgi:hypothetical protein
MGGNVLYPLAHQPHAASVSEALQILFSPTYGHILTSRRLPAMLGHPATVCAGCGDRLKKLLCTSSHYCPGGREVTVFCTAASTSSGMISTIVLNCTAPVAFTAREATHAS